MTESVFQFSGCRVDLASRKVTLDGQDSRIEPRAFDLLAYLICQRHRVVTKNELMHVLWPRVSGSAGALKQAVMKVRQAIGDQGNPPLILTVPRVGYRFMLPPRAGETIAPALEHGAALTVAVLPFDNTTGDPSLDWVELGLMSVVAHGLSQDRRLSLSGMQSFLTEKDRNRLSERSAMPAALQHATGAQRVVSGRVLRHDTGYRLALEVIGSELPAHALLSADTPAALAGPATQALLDRLLPGAAAAAGFGSPAWDLLAIEAFARGLQAAIEQKFAAAIKLFRLATDIEPNHPGAQLELLRAQAAMGDDEAEALAQRLMSRAEKQGDVLLAAHVHQAMGRLYLNRSSALPQAASRLEQALQVAAGRETPDWTAQTLLLQAAAQVKMHQFEATRRSLDLIEQLCAGSGNRIFPLAVLNMRAVMASVEGDLQHAVELSTQVVRSARALRAHRYLVDACDNIAHDLAALGRLAEAVPYAEEAMATAVAMGDWGIAADVAPTLCLLHRLAGVPGASAQLLAALAHLNEIAASASAWAARGHCAAGAGHDAEAAACFEKAAWEQREVNNTFDEHRTLPWLVEALVRCGRLADAQAELDRLSVPPYTYDAQLMAHLLHGRALLAHAQGRHEDASALLEQLLEAPAAHALWKAWACASATWLNPSSLLAQKASALLGAIEKPAR